MTAANTFPLRRRFRKAPRLLEAGGVLASGERLTSANRLTKAVMRKNGNLAVVNEAGVQWVSGTRDTARGGYARLSSSGNLAIFDRNGKRVWSTETGGTGGAVILKMRNDGQLIIRNKKKIVWRTRTHTDVVTKGAGT